MTYTSTRGQFVVTETAHGLIAEATRSVAELRALGHTPVRIRIHPLDAETLIAAYMPDAALSPLERLLGLPVEVDESARLGVPVAEVEENSGV